MALRARVAVVLAALGYLHALPQIERLTQSLQPLVFLFDDAVVFAADQPVQLREAVLPHLVLVHQPLVGKNRRASTFALLVGF